MTSTLRVMTGGNCGRLPAGAAAHAEGRRLGPGHRFALRLSKLAQAGRQRVDDHEQVVRELFDLGEVRPALRLAARPRDVFQREGVEPSGNRSRKPAIALSFRRSARSAPPRSTSSAGTAAADSGRRSSPPRWQQALPFATAVNGDHLGIPGRMNGEFPSIRPRLNNTVCGCRMARAGTFCGFGDFWLGSVHAGAGRMWRSLRPLAVSRVSYARCAVPLANICSRSHRRRCRRLLARFIAGDRSALDELFRRYRSVAFRVAYRLLGREADAMDAVQDGFVNALTHLDRFGGRSSFKTWLLRVVCNAALDIGRQRKRDERVPQAPRDPSPDLVTGPDDQAGLADAGLERADFCARTIDAALARLPDSQRQTFVLHVEGELTYREVADALGISIGTVMSRLFYARQKLNRPRWPWSGREAALRRDRPRGLSTAIMTVSSRTGLTATCLAAYAEAGDPRPRFAPAAPPEPTEAEWEVTRLRIPGDCGAVLVQKLGKHATPGGSCRRGARGCRAGRRRCGCRVDGVRPVGSASLPRRQARRKWRTRSPRRRFRSRRARTNRPLTRSRSSPFCRWRAPRTSSSTRVPGDGWFPVGAHPLAGPALAGHCGRSGTGRPRSGVAECHARARLRSHDLRCQAQVSHVLFCSRHVPVRLLPG